MTSRLSIALLNNFGGPSLGGGEVQLITLLKGIRDAGADVTLACAEDSELQRIATEMGGVRVIAVEFGSGSLTSVVRALSPQLRGVAIVQGTGFLTNIVARRLGRAISARVVNTVQVIPGDARLDAESAPRALARNVLDITTRGGVDRFVAVSAAVADGLVGQGIARKRVAVIPNGIDMAALQEAAAAPLGQVLAPARWRIGYAGRLEPIKGCEHFIRAAALLAENHPDAAFYVAGTGSLAAELDALAASLGLADRMAFVGYVDSLAPLLAQTDVVVVPSLSEAFGLTAAEALALGVPVVATAVGGLPEIVVDGETGLLVPPADAEAIAAAVSRLLGDPELARRLGSAGAERVGEQFTDEAMVEGYLKVYGGLRER
jgi:glycosyltransferase involved in cell wall biosynthesis